jgi:hypothetical protein
VQDAATLHLATVVAALRHTAVPILPVWTALLASTVV